MPCPGGTPRTTLQHVYFQDIEVFSNRSPRDELVDQNCLARCEPILTNIDNCGITLIKRSCGSGVVIREWTPVQLRIIDSFPIVHALIRDRANAFSHDYVNMWKRSLCISWNAEVTSVRTISPPSPLASLIISSYWRDIIRRNCSSLLVVAYGNRSPGNLGIDCTLCEISKAHTCGVSNPRQYRFRLLRAKILSSLFGLMISSCNLMNSFRSPP